jgi:hypothetical protein
MLYVPPTRNYTARNIYRQVYGPGLPLFGAPLAAAPAYAPWIPQPLGPPQLTNRQISAQRLRNLINAGGRRYANIQGRTHNQTTGQPYRRHNNPVIQRRIQQIYTIPRAIFSSAPLRFSRTGLIALGLTRNAHNANGVQRPALPMPIARQIGQILRRLERMNVRNNPTGPLPRSLRALPAPPRNNGNNSGSAARRSRSNSNSNNSNNSSRPRRRARGNA